MIDKSHEQLLYIHQAKTHVYTFQSDYANALKEIDNALNVHSKLNAKKFIKDFIGLKINKSIAYSELGLFDLAKNEIIEVKEKFKNEQFLLTSILTTEYLLYAKMNDFKRAIETCLQILRLSNNKNFENIDETKLVTNINLTEYYCGIKDFVKAKHHLDYVLNHRGSQNFMINSTVLKPYVFNVLSRINLHKKLFFAAIVSSDSAIFFAKKNNDLKILGDAYNQKGQIFVAQKKHLKALECFELSRNLFKNLKNSADELTAIDDVLINRLSVNQDFKSLQLINDYIKLKDSVFSNKIATSITASEVRYQTNLKETKIKTQQLELQKEKTNKYLAFGGIGVLMLLGAGGFLWFRNQQKQTVLKTQNTLLGLQQELVAAELANLNKQLDPHEIKNLLASISPEIQEKAPESYKKMLKLFNLTKASLNSSSITDSVENQLQQIDDFLSLEKNMLSVPLRYFIENSVETNKEIPRFLLKNLVENSLKHGIKKSETGGEINIKLSNNNDNIFIEIDDTCIGRKHAISLDSGIGTTTYQKLFATLNPKNKDKATFEIIDKQQGTKVEVKIPTNYKYS